jgi:hypothetical protein
MPTADRFASHPLNDHRRLSGIPTKFMDSGFLTNITMMFDESPDYFFDLSSFDKPKIHGNFLLTDYYPCLITRTFFFYSRLAQLNAAICHAMLHGFQRIAVAKTKSQFRPDLGLMLCSRKDDPYLINVAIQAIFNSHDSIGRQLTSVLPKSAFLSRFEDLSNEDRYQLLWRAEEAYNKLLKYFELADVNDHSSLNLLSCQELAMSFGEY